MEVRPVAALLMELSGIDKGEIALVVVCDDGSVWRRAEWSSDGWMRLGPSVPGTLDGKPVTVAMKHA